MSYILRLKVDLDYLCFGAKQRRLAVSQAKVDRRAQYCYDVSLSEGKTASVVEKKAVPIRNGSPSHTYKENRSIAKLYESLELMMGLRPPNAATGKYNGFLCLRQELNGLLY
jgi:hypothetical protein